MIKQYCSKLCIPKLKYFGITKDMTLSVEKDSDGNIITINMNPCYQNLPPVTIQGGSLMYLKNNEYVNFDSSSYKNVFVKEYKDSLGSSNEYYSISIEPLDCSKEMIISNIHLNTPSDKIIYDVKIDNSVKITSLLPISNSISSQINNTQYYNKKNICQKSLYFPIKKDSIIDAVIIHGDKIESISINDDVAKKPIFSVSSGSLQYLDSDGSYKNFKDEEYQNIDLELYQLKDLLGETTKYNDFYALRIFPKDSLKPMILGDQTIYPFQNYELKNVSETGEIDVMPITNYLSILLN